MTYLDYILQKISQKNYINQRVRGDFDLNPGMPREKAKLISAAVLIPLVVYKDNIKILLTKRNKTLTHHPGQISFPGGHVEPQDNSPEDTALRETKEEIGVCQKNVKVIGKLDLYETRTGFSIVPIVGLVYPPFEVKLDPKEVTEVFEVPLCFLLDSKNHERHNKSYRGQDRKFYALPYNNYFIWGATAGILINLYDILQQISKEN